MTNEWLQTIGNMYWFFMLVAYPLTIRNGYFDIATAKLVLFYVVAFLFIISNIIVRTICKIKGENLGALSLPKFEKIILGITALSFLITYIKNDDYLVTFFGFGEYHLSLLFLYTIILVYFFLRQIPVNSNVFSICAVSGSIGVSALAICQFIGLDIGKLFSAVAPYTDPHTFMTTMSNRDMVGFYFVFTFPFAIYLASFVDKRKILGIIGAMTSGVGMIVCDADMAILCFAIEILLIVILFHKDEDVIQGLMWCMLAFGGLVTVISLYCKFTGHDYNMDFIPSLFINPVFGGVVIFASIGLLFGLKRINTSILKIIAIIGLAIICLYPIYIIVYTNLIGDNPNFAFNKYLYFCDTWGSNRGQFWTTSWIIFRDGTILDKLFGFGNHGFAKKFYFTALSMSSPFYDYVYKDAHNMYIHFLIEYGLVGLAATVTWFVYRARTMLSDTDLFFRFKGMVLVVAMINAILLFCSNINMGFVPCLL